MNRERAKKLTCWGTKRDAFMAPETGPCIVGTRQPDGKRIATSPIVEVDGRFVQTASGSVYELVDADPDFVAFLKSKGYPFDPENPIKLVSKFQDLTVVKGWPS